MIEGALSFFAVKDLLFDDFGNDRHLYEIEVFDKFSDGSWRKVETKLSDRSNNIVLEDENKEKKLYFRSGDSLIPLNMDFDSPSCHRCYQVGKEIPVTHRVVSNEVLLEAQSDFGGVYKLQKQSYSDTQPFYYFTDPQGDFRVNHGNHDLIELMENLKKFFARDLSISKALSEFKLPLDVSLQKAEDQKSKAEEGRHPFSQQIER